MKTFTYLELTSTALDFICFCKDELKIKDLSGSWVIEAIRLVDGLSKTLNNEETKTLYLKLNNQNLETLWSLTQLMELEFIYDKLIKPRIIDANALKPRVKKIIMAPLLPINEDKNTNEPRNILFELILLGEFLTHGFNAKIQRDVSSHPDIEVTVNNRSYSIECKRIFKLKTFVRNFNHAKAQLENYVLNKQKDNYGIIAINVARVFNRGDKLLAAQGEMNANNKALDELEFLFKQFENQLHNKYNLKIPALFLHLSTPVVLDKQKPFLAWGHYLAPCELSNSSQISLFHLIRSDFSRLSS